MEMEKELKNKILEDLDSVEDYELSSLLDEINKYVQQRRRRKEEEERIIKEKKELAKQYFKLKYPNDYETNWFWGTGRDNDDYLDFRDGMVQKIPFKEIKSREKLFEWIDNFIHNESDVADNDREDWELYYSQSDEW